ARLGVIVALRDRRPWGYRVLDLEVAIEAIPDCHNGVVDGAVFSVDVGAVALGYELRDAEATENVVFPAVPAAGEELELTNRTAKLSPIGFVRALRAVLVVEPLGDVAGIRTH